MEKIVELTDLAGFRNGQVAAVFRRELRRVMEDIHDRPATGAARTIAITLHVEPVVDAEGQLCEIKFHVVMPSAKLPPSRTREVSCASIGVEGLLYNDTAPDDHRQRTIDQELSRNGEADADAGE